MKDVDWNNSHRTQWSRSSRHPSYEGCGLKCPNILRSDAPYQSSFVWRMWIEIEKIKVIVTVISVILRMKDVDWNTRGFASPAGTFVILRMKDVDWNPGGLFWISITMSHPSYEGCGLKSKYLTMLLHYIVSSFVWRMWIEITPSSGTIHTAPVILRMKDVDWNFKSIIQIVTCLCHPSYEGCGLKYRGSLHHLIFRCHPSYEGCGLKLDKI